MVYTVDASVILSAFNLQEAGNAQSRALLQQFEQSGTPMIEPTLLLPEVAAVIRRGRQDEQLAREFALTLSALPHLVLVPLDEGLAGEAAAVAAQRAMRGSDAVYAATAFRYGASLVTLDLEQRDRVAAVVDCYTPEEILTGGFEGGS